MKRIAIAIVSGGMDSATLTYLLKEEGYGLHILSFDYGQRHKKELDYAKVIASRLGATHDIVDLSALGHLLKGSALTDNIEIPEGHYAADNMKVTVVPNRNAIMLSIAYGTAVALDADIVAAGMHAGDHFVYPDCRPDFVKRFAEMQRVAVEGFGHHELKLYAPFINISKADIARRGFDLGVDFSKTWSCYKGGKFHCGKCGTCVERIEAFELAGVPDPTEYI